MKRSKAHLLLGAGLFLQAVTRFAGDYVNIPDVLHIALNLIGIALMMWGVVLIARSPQMRNSRLRQWKLRLIGRGTE